MGQEESSLELPLRIKEFIPDDIFYVIFTFLNYIDIRNVKLSSKRFYFLAQLARSSFVHQGKSFSRDPKIVSNIIEILTEEKNSKKFRRFILDGLHLFDADLRKIMTGCPKIHELSLEYCTDLTVNFCSLVMEFGGNIRILNLLGNYIDEKGMKAISTIPLESFSCCALPYLSSESTEGSSFTLFEFFVSGEKAINLKRLHVSFKSVSNIFTNYSPQISSIGSQNFFSKFPKGPYPSLKKLELLSFSNRENDDSQYLQSLFPSIDFVEFLEDYNSYGNEKLDVHAVLKNLPHTKLKHLRLSRLANDAGRDKFEHYEPFTQLVDLIVDRDTTSSVSYRSPQKRVFQFSKLLNCKKTLRNLQVACQRLKFVKNVHDGSWNGYNELKHLVEFKNIQKLQISFLDIHKMQFNQFVVPFLKQQGHILRHLDIFLPNPSSVSSSKGNKMIDMSFVSSLVRCICLGLKNISDKVDVDAVVKVLIESSGKGLLKELRELNLSGIKGMKKWMVGHLLENLRGLEELLLFRSSLDPRDFIDMREKYKYVKLFVL